ARAGRPACTTPERRNARTPGSPELDMLSQDRRTVLNRAIRQRLGVPTSTTTTQEEASTMTAHTTPALTPRTLALFLEYARDAGNWSGTPLVGGNVGGSKEDRGNITQMKRAGVGPTFVDS